MKEFSDLKNDLFNNINTNTNFFKRYVQKNPSLIYNKLNELSNFIGLRYDLVVELHFPNSKKIYDIDSYGTENISIIMDKFQKTFPIPRDLIKQHAKKFFEKAKIIDAYMYEGKEGIKIIFPSEENLRIEILPGSLHLWVKIDYKVEEFCNWLLENVYLKGLRNKKR